MTCFQLKLGLLYVSPNVQVFEDGDAVDGEAFVRATLDSPHE